MKRLLFSIAMFFAVAGCQSSAGRVNMTDLDGSLQPLRERFNAEKDGLRIVALFSPV